MSDSKCCLRIGALESWWTVMFITCLWLNVGHAQGLKRDLTRQSDVNEYADELTGFGRLKGLTKSFTRVDVNDNNTPFLHAQINGKKGVWLVEIKNVRLKLKSAAPGFKDKYVRTFQVFVDPNTGHLLKITSTFDGNDPNMLPEPPAAVAEAQMKNSGDETYHGFPNEPPKVSLLGALNEVTVGNPLFAKEIYAVYVIDSKMTDSPMGWGRRPVWAITLRGLDPPIQVMGAGRDVPKEYLPPVWQRNRMRNIVDAVTGKGLYATSCPRPLPPKEREKQ